MEKQNYSSLPRRGSLEVICGCMYSGKTEELIRRVRREQIAGRRVRVFKSHLNTRYTMEGIVTHTGEKIEAERVSSSKTEYLKKSIVPEQIDAIAIDEIQFFDKEIVSFCDSLADRGVRVIVAGLDMDYRGEPFPGPMSALMAKADKLLKLNAVCEVCGGRATRSQRLVNGEPAKWDEATLVVGARETYQARCREHHEISRPETEN